MDVGEQDLGDRIAESNLCFYQISQNIMRWFVVVQQGSGRVLMVFAWVEPGD